MKTIKFHKFVAQFKEIQDDQPDYRIGQHFINVAIRDRANPRFNTLWNMKNEWVAIGQIMSIMESYDWGDEIPILPEVQEWYGE